ncbi:hypothetical protein TNCV_366221 [Trichonephila clavipes]|nr:hypothetical protein TNCV_366221 [Trichonephila clavipes]
MSSSLVPLKTPRVEGLVNVEDQCPPSSMVCHIKIMYDSSSFANPTALAHADTSRDVLPRGGTSQYSLAY